MLAEYDAEPQTWQAPLAAQLSESGADADDELIAAAQALMSLVDATGRSQASTRWMARGSQGVQVGDRNTQTNTFGPGPADRQEPAVAVTGGSGAGQPRPGWGSRDAQGVQVGDDNTQVNQFIEQYFAQLGHSRCLLPRRQVWWWSGEVPQRAPAFQPRAGLVDRLGGRARG